MKAIFLQLNSEGLYQSSAKGKERCCPVLPSSTKREIRHFHVVVVQRRLRNVQKNVVQSCRFANVNLLLLRRTLILRNLILAHSRSSRCPGTTKILNAFNYFFVLNAVVNLLRGN